MSNGLEKAWLDLSQTRGTPLWSCVSWSLAVVGNQTENGRRGAAYVTLLARAWRQAHAGLQQSHPV